MPRNYLRELYEKRITPDEYYTVTFSDSVVIVAGRHLFYCPFESCSEIAKGFRKYCGFEIMIADVLKDLQYVYDLGPIDSFRDPNQASFFAYTLAEIGNLVRLREEHKEAIVNKYYKSFY